MVKYLTSDNKLSIVGEEKKKDATNMKSGNTFFSGYVIVQKERGTDEHTKKNRNKMKNKQTHKTAAASNDGKVFSVFCQTFRPPPTTTTTGYGWRK